MTKTSTETTFQQRLKKTENLFIPFIMGGDPHPDVTVELAYRLQQSGADVLELGVPYSDPLADGPTIQEAAARAIEQGMNLTSAIRLVPKMRERGLEIPVVIFTYYNPVMQYGLERLFKELGENGADALLIPDIPYEESEELRKLSNEYGIELISLVAPNSEDRVMRIAEQARGFLYCVSSLGVTGERATIQPNIEDFLNRVKSYSSVPVAVGFGVSTNDQVRLLNQYCDGVIIGSKIVKLIEARADALVQEDTREEALQAFQQEIEALISTDE
ncbi:tryptophan synthase subunit alpha [Pontibacillus halophilus JSM 076056 = DSM 19796]|uniref:Tryptophan synthase alpha chain n=1 Tax=Pontibacillus halophilus JSM 076056 = DSM 19796 TaxID=1385510 RepID=A0A0A5IDV9_9BACI|nr:tryptophan synthase subunit alpha [Pontibacillus halophilus]KGX93992.1 tryptophan synthase subunit alpha [Pontibacillus halophilus JSM 076056 = DSM 19796]